MRLNILVIDDNKPTRKLLVEYATALGCDCVEAENGGVAVEFLENGGVDGMFLDILMPEKDGFEVIRWLQIHEMQIPVIVFTNAKEAVGMPFGEMAERLGAAKSFDKPITKDIVAEAIGQIEAILRGK